MIDENSLSCEDIEILEELIDKKISFVKNISKKLEISEKSLFYHIKKINSNLLSKEGNKIELYNDKLLYLKNFKLIEIEEELRKLKKPSKRLRKQIIIVKIIFSNEVINLTKMMSFLSTSRNTLKSDIREIFAENNINEFDYYQSDNKLEYIRKRIRNYNDIRRDLLNKYIYYFINGTDDMYTKYIVNSMNESLKIYNKNYLNMIITHMIEEQYSELRYSDYSKLIVMIILMISNKKGSIKKRGLEIRENYLKYEKNVAHQLKKIEDEEEVFFTAKEKNEIIRFISKSRIGIVDSGSIEYQVSDTLVEYYTEENTIENVLFIKDVGEEDFENVLIKVTERYKIKNHMIMSFLEYSKVKIFGNISCAIFVTESDSLYDVVSIDTIKILINLKNYENDIQALKVIKKIQG